MYSIITYQKLEHLSLQLLHSLSTSITSDRLERWRGNCGNYEYHISDLPYWGLHQVSPPLTILNFLDGNKTLEKLQVLSYLYGKIESISSNILPNKSFIYH